MEKRARKLLDFTVGNLVRFSVRAIALPFIRLNYRITRDIDPKAYAIKKGALVFANHISIMDGPVLVNEAWRFARLRPTAKYAEYEAWTQKWAMMAFGVIRVSSPRSFPPEQRAAIAKETNEIMEAVVENGWGFLMFPEGFIRIGKVSISPNNTGAYNLVRKFPDKPVVLVTISGLEHSRLGGLGEKASLWRRLPVHIRVRVFEGFEAGESVAHFNARLSEHFNTKSGI